MKYELIGVVFACCVVSDISRINLCRVHGLGLGWVIISNRCAQFFVWP